MVHGAYIGRAYYQRALGNEIWMPFLGGRILGGAFDGNFTLPQCGI